MSHGDQNGVGPPAVGLGFYVLYKLTTGRVESLKGTQGQALGTALGDRVAGVELGALKVGDHQELEANRAAAEDEYGFAFGNAGLLHRFNNGVNRLDEGCFFEAYIVGQGPNAALRNPRHGFDVFAEATAIGSNTRGQTRGFVLLALRKETIFTVKAGATRRVVKTHDPVAGLPFRDPGANGNHGAG